MNSLKELGELPADLAIVGDWPQWAQGRLEAIQAECENKTPQECAARLRQFNYDVSENLAASMSEDGYTVTKTVVRKGLRYVLAEREFMDRLLSDEAP